VPPGKIATVVTYLEMTQRSPPRPTGFPGFDLIRLGPGDTGRYRRIYRSIGERWFWFSRLQIAEEALRGVLADPGIEAYAVAGPQRDVGLLELDFRTEGEAEIVYFGLVDAMVGQGAGRWLMNRTLEIAWSRPIRRLWLHTCTLDHPGAVAFYRRSGFRPYKAAIEVADDPRLTGGLPPDSFPDVPLTRP
jgi:GNAT superfamily N-acetyltransferase